MAAAVIGDTVKVHYTGSLDDDFIFDSSRDREPLQFTIGTGQVIPGFEEAVIGLEPGATARTHIPAEQAYGPKIEELRISVERSQLPAGLEVQLGDQLQMQTQDGQTVPVEVVELADESVVVDANHPLAGKALTFEIELVEVA
ncbi:MAG: FKBP-type peptidyl-prolyl cis-trans isomerase [Gemmatimonadetes bacterium]|nr:FKBP-type peptidyl-prolyl cis-trans isomerase [Gemmatimonadota bacterium]